ncbi:MAG: OmpH family outer membrane protein [Pseudomonadota bacterium]|nr:OmpH family outer membrane protein [Pseudomonadota bacterium]
MKQLASLFILLLATAVCAAESATIGYVDMQQVIEQSKMGQQAQETLKEKFDGKQKALAEEEQAIRALQQNLARDEALMSQTELDKKKGELQQRIQAFQKQAAAAQQELLTEQNKLGGEILSPAQEVIAEVAKEKGIPSIFERRQSGLLYIDESLDLTAEVIRRLDARGEN